MGTDGRGGKKYNLCDLDISPLKYEKIKKAFMKIEGKEIEVNKPCFIVAEAGLAHEGRLDYAFSLIDLAVEASADAIKFQVYKTGELIDKGRGGEFYERFRRKELRYGDFVRVQAYARAKGIIWFATPHTDGALEFLEALMVPCYKVGSGEINGGLLASVLSTGKPVFFSLGLRSEKDALYTSRFISINNKMAAPLHCVTQYPVPAKDANLAFMKKLGGLYGYSSHCVGYLDCLVAVALGAKVIEKHIKLPESTGQDCAGALFGDEFRNMVRLIRKSEEMLGDGNRYYTGAERKNESWALKGRDGKRPL